MPSKVMNFFLTLAVLTLSCISAHAEQRSLEDLLSHSHRLSWLTVDESQIDQLSPQDAQAQFDLLQKFKEELNASSKIVDKKGSHPVVRVSMLGFGGALMGTSLTGALFTEKFINHSFRSDLERMAKEPNYSPSPGLARSRVVSRSTFAVIAILGFMVLREALKSKREYINLTPEEYVAMKALIKRRQEKLLRRIVDGDLR